MIFAFDFDNTLFCDTRFLHDLKVLFASFGITESMFEKDYQYHRNKKALYSPFIQYRRIKKAHRLERSERAFRKAYHEKFQNLEKYLHPGAVKMLSVLSRHSKLAVVSYGASAFQRIKIKSSHIEKYFDRILISEDTKTDEVLFLSNLWKKERVVFIDDKEEYVDDVKRKLPDTFVLQMHAPCCVKRTHSRIIDGSIQHLSELVALSQRPASEVVPRISISHLGRKESASMAARLLARGKILAVPSETSYGLAANATRHASIHRLYSIKTRSTAKKLPIMVGSLEQLKQYCRTPQSALRWIARYYRKTVSFRVHKRSGYLRALGTDPTVVVRVAQHPFLKSLAEKFHGPFTITSANISSQPPIFSRSEFLKQFSAHKHQIDAFVDYGTLKPQPPSTILDVTENPPKILRQGKTKITNVSQNTHISS
jgi:L-threonylcarbamoyladenylate synthase